MKGGAKNQRSASCGAEPKIIGAPADVDLSSELIRQLRWASVQTAGILGLRSASVNNVIYILYKT